ncbi:MULTISPECIES: hypothetical protein [unclassified Variovorax]|uniref:hypothetical protein n=1 Tax=unclassified Variovorax TaxID=663243 RepID=UPI001BD5D2A0|nr:MULTISPECIES: hypothetical protein [unclassified Variovorax]
MNATFARTTRIVLVAVTLGACASAFAGEELLGVDSNFRARIAKEKIRASAQERRQDEQQKKLGINNDNQGFGQNPTSTCGSQNIGNVDTGGRIGAQPREVFVFAPNAINLVGRGGCN